MTVINLQPVLDTLSGGTAKPATFTAEARAGGTAAARVSGATVTFPDRLVATYSGTSWSPAPALSVLPAGYYWWVRVALIDGIALERCVQLPAGATGPVDFGSLVEVDPQSSEPSPTRLSLWLAAVDQRVIAGTALVGRTGQWADLAGKPTIPTTPAQVGAEPAGLSSATQTALSSQIATAIAGVVAGAPAALDTLLEIAAQLQADEAGAASLATLVATKQNAAQVTAAINAALSTFGTSLAATYLPKVANPTALAAYVAALTPGTAYTVVQVSPFDILGGVA